MSEKLKAYYLGVWAFANRDRNPTNPYATESRYHATWGEGWSDAESGKLECVVCLRSLTVDDFLNGKGQCVEDLWNCVA